MKKTAALSPLLLALCISLMAMTPSRADTMAQALAAYEAGDSKTAAQLFQGLSAQQLPLADYNLAMMHLRAELPQPEPQKARRLLERAAAHRLVRAELALGQFYEMGLQSKTGKSDLAQANRWYARAAEHGSVDAQVALATAFYLGRGIAKNEVQAAHWFRAAANGGDVGAQYLLASMYETGLGLAPDLRLARYWYEIAAANGDEAAPFKLKEVDARLGSVAAPQTGEDAVKAPL
ncbi:sel1 repeat family protein [Paucibacter sp. KBW04]|uniref:tetratricopeptide repeat protein n=1 Tax=Paucibacter sp. KBW04 TaxID=2153361 RepID=UPI000F559EC8|nr:tetratricopeptide repeat protein [Paucibacter sp. KBW04]RQO54356.1 sel1 repeat family protein [Paucibacter sp. KBW04]